jgi:hypothetical protein
MLAAVAAELLRAPAPGGDVSCAACQDALDAYIDCERRHGVAVALGRYPQVWWHLWTCSDCAEVYHLTGALLDAEDQRILMPIPVAAPPQPAPRLVRWPALRLPRGFLHSVFAPHVALGTAWSGGEHETLFAEEERDGYHIAVSVRRHDLAYWAIVVAITPPIGGWAAVDVGEQHFRAPFDQRGRAEIAGVPLALLTERVGADMLVTIEANDTSA